MISLDYMRIQQKQANGDEQIPIVLLHGYCGSLDYWLDVASHLGEQGFSIIVPSLPGHGRSPTLSDGDYSMERLAKEIIHWLDELDVGQCHLFGHSLGGYVTLALAEQDPNRLKSFGLIHSTPLPDSDEIRERRLNAIQLIEENGVAPFVHTLIPKLFAYDHRQGDAVQQCIQIGLGTSVQAAVGCARGMMNRIDRQHVIQQYSGSVLLVAGAKDDVIPVERTFVTTGNHITHELLQQSGHMGMLEQPMHTAQLIINFISNTKEQ